ncbi:MAG TPA: diguanylate cyclase [Acidothermaceae bacterium]|nr:diguanylate cyclase [Acidothermaceae bacterium]
MNGPSRAAQTPPSRSRDSSLDADRRITQRGRLAALGIVLILLGVSGFAVWSSHATAVAARNAALANRLSDAYVRADSAVAAEESLERKYRLEPSSAVRARYDASAASFVTAMHDVDADGGAGDSILAAKVLAQQAGYLEAMDRMFAQVDLGDTAAVLTIDGGEVDPLFGAIESEVSLRSAEEHAHALDQLANSQHLDTLTSRLTPAVFGLGLLFVALLAGAGRGYRRMLRAERAGAVEHSLHDPLTGLANRALLTDRLEAALQAATGSGAVTGLLLIDLDRFKEINDTFGHKYGDQLLIQIGRRFAAVVGDADTVARIGGDEFAVLLPNIKDLAAANEIAENLQRALESSLNVEGVELDVDASIGLVLSGEHGTDATTLLQHADVAMYVAKTRNVGIFAYSREVDDYSPVRLALLGDLRHGLEMHEIVLHYQPKVNVASGKVVGVEALARWQHPTQGLLYPDSFIPAAEHTGLIGPFTRYVLDAALAQAKVWADGGMPLPVSVNLSGRNLLDENLPTEVSDLLAAYGVPASLLELEVTESAIMLDPIRARRLLQSLADLGIRLSIDDFGAGYTSLSQLKTLPVDELKIDRSFVMTMASDARDALIVHSVIELGQNLGLNIVAEGVETAQALVTLRGFGCDIAQGYYIAKPAPAKTFEAWLIARETAAPVPVAVTPTRRAGDAVLVERDLGEAMSPAAALRASEERFRALFTLAPIGIAETRADGTIVAVNPRACEMLGYQSDELIGQPSSMLTDPRDRAQQAKDIAEASSTDGYAARRTYRRKDGTPVAVLISVAVVRQTSGAVSRMVGMMVDISELEEAQQSIAAASVELATHQMFTDSLLDNAGAGILACDTTGELTVINRTARRWHGLDPDIEPSPEQRENLTAHLFDADGVTPLGRGNNPLMRAFRDGITSRAEMVIAPPNAAATRVIATGTSLRGPMGEAVGAVVTMHDVTLLRQRESELHESAAFQDAVLAASPDVIFVADAVTNRNLWSSRSLSEYGYTDEQMKELADNTIEMLVHPDDRFRVRDQNAAARALSNSEVVRIRYRIRVPNDVYRWFARGVTPFVRNDAGEVTQLLGVASDVTELVRIEQQLAEAALHDALTGLPNRTLLVDRLSNTLARTNRSGQELAVLFCDLDGFKAVNEDGGHEAGDAVLEATAARLLATVRAEDTAARVGGDGFVVIVEPSSRTWAGPDGAPIDVRSYAVQLAERLEAALAVPIDFDARKYAVTVSIGLAFAHAGDDVEDVLAQAGAAMYRAKRLGKNRHEIAIGLLGTPVS